MTMTTAILVNLFLLSSAAVALSLELSKRRTAAGVCMTAVLLAYAFNIFHVVTDNGGPYFAFHNAVHVHNGECVTVKAAIKNGEPLDPYPSVQAAMNAGLTPHHCITNRNRTYTAAATEMPHRKPSTKIQTLSTTAAPASFIDRGGGQP